MKIRNAEKYDGMLKEGWEETFVNELMAEEVFEEAIDSLKDAMKKEFEERPYSHNWLDLAKEVTLADAIRNSGIAYASYSAIRWFLEYAVPAADDALDLMDKMLRYVNTCVENGDCGIIRSSSEIFERYSYACAESAEDEITV